MEWSAGAGKDGGRSQRSDLHILRRREGDTVLENEDGTAKRSRSELQVLLTKRSDLRTSEVINHSVEDVLNLEDIIRVQDRCWFFCTRTVCFAKTRSISSGSGRQTRSQNMSSMEAAEVCAILKIVSERLAPLLNEEYNHILGATKRLQDLHSVIEEVIFLVETEEQDLNHPHDNWLQNLKDVTYAVENIIDEYLKAHEHGNGGTVFKYLCTKPQSFMFHIKVRAIMKRFDAFMKRTVETRRNFNSLPSSHALRNTNVTLPLVNEDSVIARDHEKREVISKLLENDDQHITKVVSIIGLGGSGKTTLAQLVCNDHEISQHFQVKLWVHVSQEFDLTKLIRKLFEAITYENPEQHSLSFLAKTILDKLSGKRFLLILDDVWTQSSFQWERFIVHLRGGIGSRILLTARDRGVAEAVGSRDIINLTLLSEIDSWLLFSHSFGHLDPAFVQVGKEIVKKCGGLPLAIKVLAGVLRTKNRIEQWEAVIENNSLIHDEGVEERPLAVLRLSYIHLPYRLKRCFTICSVFPKGYKIDKEKLMDLWIAHDMINLQNGIGDKFFDSLVHISFLQDVVRDHCGRVSCSMHNLVHDLALRILGEEISVVVPKEPTSFAKSFRYFSWSIESINGLPDNLFEKARAIYLAASDGIKFGKGLQNSKHLCSIIVEYAHTTSVSKSIFQVKSLKYLEISRLKCEALPEYISEIWSLQALHVTYSNLLNIPKSIGKLQKLRTLNLSWCNRLQSLPDSIGNCCMISSIDLSGCSDFEVLPNSVGANKSLRIIRLGYTKIERIPSTITSLGNLECLDLQWCHELVELPEGFENLKKLQVLNLEGCKKLRAMTVGIGQLSQLQNLSTFVVGEVEKSAKISELENINSISGELTIKGIACVTSPDDAHNTCLERKTNLQSLQLHWGVNDTHKGRNVEAVLDGLRPPFAIKVLHIVGYAGVRYAQWMLNQFVGEVHEPTYFPFLTVMTLCGFQNLKNLEGLMELRCLEELKLQWMPLLRRISGGPFPSLVKLRMEGLRSLGEVWMADGTLSDGDGDGGRIKIGERLSDLHIEECPKLMLKSCFPSSLEHLVLKRSNDQLLLLPGQGQGKGPSSSSSFPPSCSFNQLKELELWGMAASSSSPPPAPGSGSKHEWELLKCMSALESLKICQCGGLTELPDSMRSLTSLQSLFINFCSAICMLPEWLGGLHSLRKMYIQSCHRLSDLQSIVKLASLQELRIERCDEIHLLPECLGELCSLRKFDIASLQGVTFLPKSMCRLTSLQELEISDCQGLTSLPEWIRGFTVLQKLKITGCPELERRCEREKGEDWHLIKHIRRLQIGLDEGDPAC